MALHTGCFPENYGQDMAIIGSRLNWSLLTGFLVLLAACPFFLSNQMLTILTTMGISVVSVHGLNILTGYCGQISIGHSGFMAVGGYASAILCAKFGWPFWAALPCAALAAGIAGLVFGLPSLKIKGFYLIMATIAAQFIIIWIIGKISPFSIRKEIEEDQNTALAVLLASIILGIATLVALGRMCGHL